MSFQLAKHLHLLLRHILRRNPVTLHRARRLSESERLPLPRLQARQAKLLRVTLERARRLRHYAAVPAAPDGADVYTWLRQHYPVIGKSDLLARRAEYYPASGRRRPWWPLGKTSGTSGTPLEVFRSLDSVLWEEAFHLQFWGWAGWHSGAPQALLRGDEACPITRQQPPFWLWDRFGRQLFLSTRHLSPCYAGAILDRLGASECSQLRAYPSSAFELARAAARLQHPLRLHAVITGSEPLYPAQRELIERTFGCQVFDFYGMAERVAFAAQCEHGSYHLHPEYAYVEILDQLGEPTDGFGHVVGTTLHNRVMPLVRYRIADRARWLLGPCPCGRSYPRIELSSGKVEEQLYDKEGVPVSASIITFALKGLKHIHQTQVAQIGPGQWEVRVVPEGGHEVDSAALLTSIADHVSQHVQLRVRTCDHIPLQSNSKFKWISQEWPGAKALGERP